MRIISGSFKGKRIVAPNNLPVRPTTDFAKEALFNVLNNHHYFDEISVLDLFAGIGSISLEFASRGCQRIYAVDKDAGCVKFISETAEKMNISDRLQVVKNEVFQFLDRNTLGGFDVIFADPFYEMEEKEFHQLIDSIRENGWLNPEGELIIEHSKFISFEKHPNLNETRRYGNVHFSFFSLG